MTIITLPHYSGAPVAQWFKSWPAVLAVWVQSLEAEFFFNLLIEFNSTRPFSPQYDSNTVKRAIKPRHPPIYTSMAYISPKSNPNNALYDQEIVNNFIQMKCVLLRQSSAKAAISFFFFSFFFSVQMTHIFRIQHSLIILMGHLSYIYYIFTNRLSL